MNSYQEKYWPDSGVLCSNKFPKLGFPLFLQILYNGKINHITIKFFDAKEKQYTTEKYKRECECSQFFMHMLKHFSNIQYKNRNI